MKAGLGAGDYLPNDQLLQRSRLAPTGFANTNRLHSGDGLMSSPAVEALHNGGDNALWVTVFGFPGRSANLVRQHLELVGMALNNGEVQSDLGSLPQLLSPPLF